MRFADEHDARKWKIEQTAIDGGTTPRWPEIMNTPKPEIIWRARGRNNKQHAVKTQDGQNWTAFCGITGGAYFNAGSPANWFHCRKCQEVISKTKP